MVVRLDLGSYVVDYVGAIALSSDKIEKNNRVVLTQEWFCQTPLT